MVSVHIFLLRVLRISPCCSILTSSFICLCCSGKPQYNHTGEIIDGIDMRAEVGLLSRNILIYGEMENSCYGDNMCQFYNHDTFGGHIKVRVCTMFRYLYEDQKLECYYICGDQQWGQNACRHEFEGIFETVVLVSGLQLIMVRLKVRIRHF